MFREYVDVKPTPLKIVAFNRYLTIILIHCRALNKTIERKETEDKSRARRILDEELLSIASKDYNPNNL